MWREGLMPLEAAHLMRSAEWHGVGQAHGEGRGVLLIPGLLAGDGSLGVMTRWLRGLGYRTRKAGIRSNVNCSTAVVECLEPRLELMADQTGERVAIIGQSRGGVIARALAKRRPDLVSGIVTLGSPNAGMLDIHPLVLASVVGVGALGTLRIPSLFRVSCLLGDCCSEFRESAANVDFPEEVGYKALYSRHDGIVNWRACLDDAADQQIEVDSTHCGMAVNPQVYGIVGRALAEFADVADEPVWTAWAQAA
jgi:pimeloyl-ACP methyl ester carboxylesterase